MTDKQILIISSSRSDRYLLEPLARKFKDECEFIQMKPPLSYAGCAELLSEKDEGKKVVLLGDRWETCLLAFHAIEVGAIICHLHGGEVTAGSKDEIWRHAITKMSHVHLTSHQIFADRIIRMGENPANVFSTGAIGVWRAKQLMIREEERQSENFYWGRVDGKNTLAVILHPNTIEPEKTESEIKILLEALKSFSGDFSIKFYAPNHDNGRLEIIDKIKAFIELYGGEYIKEEYGDDFLRSLASSKCIIGNSSCGIIEAPTLKTPTINIGSRQDGRPRAPSVMQCDFNATEIKSHIESALNDHWLDSLFNNPYDNVKHDTVDMICDIIQNHPVKFQKRFMD